MRKRKAVVTHDVPVAKRQRKVQRNSCTQQTEGVVQWLDAWRKQSSTGAEPPKLVLVCAEKLNIVLQNLLRCAQPDCHAHACLDSCSSIDRLSCVSPTVKMLCTKGHVTSLALGSDQSEFYYELEASCLFSGYSSAMAKTMLAPLGLRFSTRHTNVENFKHCLYAAVEELYVESSEREWQLVIDQIAQQIDPSLIMDGFSSRKQSNTLPSRDALQGGLVLMDSVSYLIIEQLVLEKNEEINHATPEADFVEEQTSVDAVEQQKKEYKFLEHRALQVVLEKLSERLVKHLVKYRRNVRIGHDRSTLAASMIRTKMVGGSNNASVAIDRYDRWHDDGKVESKLAKAFGGTGKQNKGEMRTRFDQSMKDFSDEIKGLLYSARQEFDEFAGENEEKNPHTGKYQAGKSFRNRENVALDQAKKSFHQAAEEEMAAKGIGGDVAKRVSAVLQRLEENLAWTTGPATSTAPCESVIGTFARLSPKFKYFSARYKPLLRVAFFRWNERYDPEYYGGWRDKVMRKALELHRAGGVAKRKAVMSS